MKISKSAGKRERENRRKNRREKEAMDEQEFRSLLQRFPVVRSRDHRADLDSSSSKQFTSQSIGEREVLGITSGVMELGINSSVDEPKDCQTDQETSTFWDKLKRAAAKKVGEVEAERFCKAFEKLHRKLVYEELDPEAAKRYLLNI